MFYFRAGRIFFCRQSIVSTDNEITISGLTLAGIYQFQIRALGVLGYTDWMDTKI
jgi:hypothetical protein